MKKTVLGLALSTFAGAAAAGDLSEPRYHESNDFSAQVVYTVAFGANSASAQSVGLRFDSVRAQAAGAPSLMHARFGAQGLDKLSLNGLDLRGLMLASNQTEGGITGFFKSLTPMQIVGLSVTVLLTGAALADINEGEPDASGTGSN